MGTTTRVLVALAAAAMGLAPSLARASAPGPAEVVAYYTSNPADPTAAAAAYARMMATPSLYTGFDPVVATPAHDPAAACPPSRCSDHVVPLPAGLEVESSATRVLLPAGYHHSDRRYPVVYVFNAGPSGHTGWTRFSRLTALTRHVQAIFVMPEGGSGASLGMFSDWLDGSAQWETFHTQVLPRWVDRHYRTIKGDDAAMGQSIAGMGVLDYAARHPGLYQAVLSLSGLVDTGLLTSDVVPSPLTGLAGFPVDLTKVWGDPVTNATTWAAHNPRALAASLRGTRLFISSGTGFPTGDTSDPIHKGYLEMLLWQGERTFLQALTQDGVPFDARIARGNAHDWPYFDRPLQWGLRGIMSVLNPSR